MAITANTQIEHRGNLGMRSYKMDLAKFELFIGQAIALDTTGYAVAAAATASYRFCGISAENQDDQKSAVAAADGTYRVKVFTKGEHKLTVTSVAVTNIGDPVWLTDNGAYQLTPTAMFVGWVTEYVTTNTAWVELAGDFMPRRFHLTLAIPTSAASSTKKSCVHSFVRAAKLTHAYVNATVYPNYATSVVDVDKYKVAASDTDEVVAATDVDAKAAGTPIALTLSATAANLLFAKGDTVMASQTLGSGEVAASDGLSVTLEYEEYGRPNS